VPFDVSYGQLLLAAAAANLAAALLQLVLVLLRVRRARKKAALEQKPEVSLRVEVLLEGEGDLQPRDGQLGTRTFLRTCHGHDYRCSSECGKREPDI